MIGPYVFIGLQLAEDLRPHHAPEWPAVEQRREHRPEEPMALAWEIRQPIMTAATVNWRYGKDGPPPLCTT